MSITTVDIVDNSQCIYIYIYPQCKLICTWCFTWHGSRKNMGHLPASHNLPICHTSSENAQLRANTKLRIGLQMSLPIPETKHFRWLTESILNKLSLGTPTLLKHARMLFYPPWWHFVNPDGPWSWNIQRKQLLWCERKGTRVWLASHHVGSYLSKIAGETTWPWWAPRNLVDAGNFSSRLPARYAANSFPSEQSSSRKSSIAWNAAMFGKKQADQTVMMGKDDKKKHASKLQIFLAGGSSRSSRPKRIHEKNLSRSIQLHFTHLLSLRHRRNGESSLRTRRRDWLPELVLKIDIFMTPWIFSVGKKKQGFPVGFPLNQSIDP